MNFVSGIIYIMIRRELVKDPKLEQNHGIVSFHDSENDILKDSKAAGLETTLEELTRKEATKK